MDKLLNFLFSQQRIILLVTAILALATSVLQAKAETIRGVRILSVHTGKCVAIKNDAAATGALVEQSTCGSGSTQLYNFVRATDNSVRIRPQLNTANCLDTNAALGISGGQMAQKTCGSSPARRQKFLLIENPDHSYQLQTMDKRCVDIAGARPDDGNPLITWDCHGEPWQSFWLVGFPLTPEPQNPAQKFMESLRFGVNIERFAAAPWGVGDFASGTAGFAYLKNLGVTHVRLFYPWRPSIHMGGSDAVDVAPRPEQFANILPAIHNAHRAGLKVFLDLTDVMGPEDFSGSRQQLVENYLAMAAQRLAAENFTPTMLAVGAVNEWATWDPNLPRWGPGYNPIFNTLRQNVLGILRRYLPNFTLTTGPAVWKHYDQLFQEDFQLSNDPNIIYDVHAYDWNATDPQHWADLSRRLQAWSVAHGNVPVLFGEAGFGYNSALPGNEASWVSAIHAMAPNLLTFAPTLWAISTGRDWRMNAAVDFYLLKDEIATALAAHRLSIRVSDPQGAGL